MRGCRVLVVAPGPDATVVVRARPEPEPVTEEGAAEDLRVNLSGVSPEFAARLSAEDLEDIAASDIPLETVQAFEQAAIAREAEDLREAGKERAGIIKHDAGLPRAAAKLEAAGSQRPSPGTGATCGCPYGRPWRATPSCWLSCPIRPARWMPYHWSRCVATSPALSQCPFRMCVRAFSNQ